MVSRSAKYKAKGRGTLIEWLNVNELTIDQVHSILARGWKLFATIDPSRVKPISYNPKINNPDLAWDLIAKAIIAFFPNQKDIIESVRKHTKTCFVVNPYNSQQAQTINEGKDNFPKIICPYSGSDLLTLAHEFSHAVQIMASLNDATPPVARELCAFLGELALLEYVQEKKPRLFGALKYAWEAQNTSYWRENLPVLKDALSEIGGEYQYAWNYPIARILALELYKEKEGEQLWELFTKGSGSPLYGEHLSVIEGLSSQVRTSPLAVALDGNSVASHFSIIGVITILDILYSGSRARRKIESYAAELQKELRSNCIFLALNAERQPFGYCKFFERTSVRGVTYLATVLEVAPFGYQKSMQISFKNEHKYRSTRVLHEE